MAYESQRAEGPSSGTPVAAPPVNSPDASTHMHEVSEGQRRRPFPTRYVLYGLLVVLLGAASSGFAWGMLLYHWQGGAPKVWLCIAQGMFVGLLYLALFQAAYYVTILHATSDKKLQSTRA